MEDNRCVNMNQVNYHLSYPTINNGISLQSRLAILAEDKALELKRKCLAFLEELLDHFIMKVQMGQAEVGRWVELVVPTF